jgi:hypothetical protein
MLFVDLAIGKTGGYLNIIEEEWYAAVKERGGDRVYAVVFLTRREVKSEWIEIKVMTEFEHPYYYNCPRRVFNKLTPLKDTDSSYAHQWRREVGSVLQPQPINTREREYAINIDLVPYQVTRIGSMWRFETNPWGRYWDNWYNRRTYYPDPKFWGQGACIIATKDHVIIKSRTQKNFLALVKLIDEQTPSIGWELNL